MKSEMLKMVQVEVAKIRKEQTQRVLTKKRKEFMLAEQWKKKATELSKAMSTTLLSAESNPTIKLNKIELFAPEVYEELAKSFGE